MHIILDYGHGSNCPGKSSPDKTFFEWKFNREVGMGIAEILRKEGYNVHETWTGDKEPLFESKESLVKSELDKCLMWRVGKVNEYCKKYGTKNCISISIHANAAASDKKFHNASGWCVMVGKKASSSSKKLAKTLYAEAIKAKLQGNRSVPSEHYWVQSLAMCDSTNCPAVLTESLFYDNESDLKILKSKEGKEKIMKLHVDGIKKYIEEL